MDSGRQQELIELLGQFGVAAIPELRPEQYNVQQHYVEWGHRSDETFYVKPFRCEPLAGIPLPVPCWRNSFRIPDQQTTEGTLAHELAELKLRNYFR